MRAASKARHLLALLLIAAALPAGGCDWLKGSETVRVSPYLRDLRISPTSVDCKQDFRVAFDYEDPQDDIWQLELTLENVDASAEDQIQVSWEPPDPALDLRTSGLAILTHQFVCDADAAPRGVWQVRVKVEDRRGHSSNVLEGTVTLLTTK